MKRLTYILSIVLTTLILGACSTHKYHTTRIESVDFKQYQTYAWLPPVDSLSKSYFDNDIAKSNILSTANTELEARGLHYDKENPDLLFRYIAIVNNKSKPIYSNNYWGWGPYGYYGYYGWYNPWYYAPSYPVGKERVRYGHIILEAIERKTNSVIWQARGSGEIRSPEKAINELPKIVSGIIKELPLLKGGKQ